MKDIVVFNLAIPAAICVPVLYFLWVSILLIIKKIVYHHILKFADRTATKLDDIILHALNLPLVLFIFVSGIFVLQNIFGFKWNGELLKVVDVVFKGTTIIAVILFLDRLLKGLMDHYARDVKILKDSGSMLPTIVRAVVFGLGILILLDSFGVSITPILASLGIGSLAIALALQPTLENFFSGVQILIDKPVSVGQFVKLDSGEEGYVEKIGWRSTWVRMLPNNVVVIPNNVLVNSKVLNYYYPQTEMAVLVQVGVHYDSDLENVEKVTIEVGEEILKTVQGGVPEFMPFIRYHTFNDFSIDFTVILRVKEFVDNYLVKHEFIKRLHKRFNEEGIIIPYPIRTLDWNEGSGPLKVAKD